LSKEFTLTEDPGSLKPGMARRQLAAFQISDKRHFKLLLRGLDKVSVLEYREYDGSIGLTATIRAQASELEPFCLAAR
jgi:hypothetical protein